MFLVGEAGVLTPLPRPKNHSLTKKQTTLENLNFLVLLRLNYGLVLVFRKHKY